MCCLWLLVSPCFIVRGLLFVVCCLLEVRLSLLDNGCGLLVVAVISLFGDYVSVIVVCCFLFVVCCLLFVVCGCEFVVWCLIVVVSPCLRMCFFSCFMFCAFVVRCVCWLWLVVCVCLSVRYIVSFFFCCCLFKNGGACWLLVVGCCCCLLSVVVCWLYLSCFSLLFCVVDVVCVLRGVDCVLFGVGLFALGCSGCSLLFGVCRLVGVIR